MKPALHGRSRSIALPLACVAALAMLITSEGAYWRSQTTLDRLGETAAASAGIQNLQQSILDAESGHRGYLLTRREEHLLPYDKAVQDIAATLLSLERHYAAEVGPAAVLGELHGLIRVRLAELASTLPARTGALVASGADAMPDDLGRAQMTAIRELANTLVEYEEQRAAEGRDDLRRTLGLGRFGVAALSALTLLALVLYLRQTAALRRQQRALKQAVQVEHDRLDSEVRRRTAQLTELTHHLQTAREDERQRLARNLHDELGALLTSAKLDAARIKARLAGSAPEAQERLAHLVGTLNSSIALGRSIIEDLRPSTLGNLGLVPTLEILASEFSENSGIAVICELAPVRLDAAAELMVYRLVQEALTNIGKHASAREVRIELGARDGVVHASVQDDGVGFDTEAPQRSAYGLVGMRFRVEAEGGTLGIDSAPGRGTRLHVALPEQAASPAPA